MTGRAVILRADARDLPLPDSSVDLIVTSPPYWQLRNYSDDGEYLEGQLGSEAHWQEYIENLVDCTREWLRVLKPEGSLFINIGDKYGRAQRTTSNVASRKNKNVPVKNAPTPGIDKTLLGLPWRYAFAVKDELGLILRAEIIWSKVNPTPESVADRVSRTHEQLFHFTAQPAYYSAVDTIREPYSAASLDTYARGGLAAANGGRSPSKARQTIDGTEADWRGNPLGKLPPSVWTIAAEPLRVPSYIKGEHWAAFPTALARPVILGWSPRQVCTACGQGRVPVTDVTHEKGWTRGTDGGRHGHGGNPGEKAGQEVTNRRLAVITGWACACTPYTDHPGTGGPYAGLEHPSGGAQGLNRGVVKYHIPERTGRQAAVPPGTNVRQAKGGLGDELRTGPWREYHLDAWDPPPSRPGVVLDPFGGTGTTALTAIVHGRTGISADLAGESARLASWRVKDGTERTLALGQPRPPKSARVHEPLYGDLFAQLDALLAGDSDG